MSVKCRAVPPPDEKFLDFGAGRLKSLDIKRGSSVYPRAWLPYRATSNRMYIKSDKLVCFFANFIQPITCCPLSHLGRRSCDGRVVLQYCSWAQNMLKPLYSTLRTELIYYWNHHYRFNFESCFSVKWLIWDYPRLEVTSITESQGNMLLVDMPFRYTYSSSQPKASKLVVCRLAHHNQYPFLFTSISAKPLLWRPSHQNYPQ